MPLSQNSKQITHDTSAKSSRAMFRSAARNKRNLERAGCVNAIEAIRITGTGLQFGNLFVALGYFNDLAGRAFSERERKDFETKGRAIMARLGVAEGVDANASESCEVLVSVPVANIGELDKLYVLGLKRTVSAIGRGFVELRGACNLDQVRAVAASLQAIVCTIDRPQVEETSSAEQPTVPSASEEARASSEIGSADGDHRIEEMQGVEQAGRVVADENVSLTDGDPADTPEIGRPVAAEKVDIPTPGAAAGKLPPFLSMDAGGSTTALSTVSESMLEKAVESTTRYKIPRRPVPPRGFAGRGTTGQTVR